MKTLPALLLGLLAATSPSAREAAAQAPTGFDFRSAEGIKGWVPLHDVKGIEATPEGMAVTINGRDPYFRSPAFDLPEGVPLTATVRVKAERAGEIQVFYNRGAQDTSEERSVRRPVRGGGWRDVTLHLPPMGPATNLRIDPPGSSGVCLFESIRFAPRAIVEPGWKAPGVPKPAADAPSVAAGPLVLRQDPSRFGSFTLSVDGRDVAVGHDRPAVAYRATVDGRPVIRWVDLVEAGAKVATKAGPADGSLRVEAAFADPDGGHWRLAQTFRPHSPGAIAFEAECAVDAPRPVFHVPLLVTLPGHGHGAFGPAKGQGLLAGVEYLDDEPSNSTADLSEADAPRRVPSSYKLTMPLMAIQARGKYVGLIWDRSPAVAPLFDSPDRTLGGGGHLMGLIAPGAEAGDRPEGTLFPDEPKVLEPGAPLKASGFLVGGEGTSIVPAVQKYVALKGLPPLPSTPGLQDYIKLAAAGWLDSPIRDGGRFRHATNGGTFSSQPASDAAWMMAWLASLSKDEALAKRLREGAEEARSAVPAGQALFAAVGHNVYPAGPLVLPAMGPSAGFDPGEFDHAARSVAGMRRWFEADGTRRYRRSPRDEFDYGKTHFSDEASGYAAQPVDRMLRLAAFSGDRDAVGEALRLLAVLRDRFRDGVPRGAQTWEVALHTPDVLASGYLVRAFALGYELTGDDSYLEAAKYWAWTGVPFVYLGDPTDAEGPDAVGPYATTPVLGSTNWVAPNWIGLPVQWCGLVYADALIDLARYDSDGPWSRIADGIAASGIRQVYPLGDPNQGLLPDSFNLISQARNPSDINPGTLLPGALRLLAGPAARPYQFRALRRSGLWVVAPGSIDVETDRPGEAAFTVRSWLPGAGVAVHGATVGDGGRELGPRTILPTGPGAGPHAFRIRTPN